MTGTPVGLCATCRHARRIVSARGSVFWLCRRSETDPAFPRYPALPVLACTGYEPEIATQPDRPGTDRTAPPHTD
jgi:hypothetical protein